MSDVGLWALVGVVFLNTLFIAALAGGLIFLNVRLNQALSQAAPLLNRATETLARVEETTAQLQQRVDVVLDKTSQLVEQVSERVDTTTAIAEEAVTEPLIGAASLMAGIHRGLRVYSEQTSSNETSTNQTSSSQASSNQKGEGRDGHNT